MDTYNIGNRPISISTEDIENIFVTALEGGSNYWYYLSKEEFDKVRAAFPRGEGLATSEAIFKAVWEKGMTIYLNDADDHSERIGELRKELILERLNKLAENTSYNYALFDELDQNGDALSSDVCFQFMALGDVWFS
jgi:hypothetical protein